MCEIAVVGLAVMGRNLALNWEEKGRRVAVYNRTWQVTADFLAENPGKRLQGAQSLEELCGLLEKPRKILLMVKAGQPVDDTLHSLLPYLEPGDIVMDGGNSFFKDTMRRAEECRARGIRFAGVGISGGEEGARHGAAILPGCARDAWQQIGPLLTQAAAVAEGEPCCAYIGENGAGHFVKMVHNGIEYADMQLIGEAYGLLRRLGGLSPAAIGRLFAQWNQGELKSYLVEITADILCQQDEQTGLPMVDVIRGKAGSKGTGKWTAQQSLDLGVPAPTIQEAVSARYLSGLEEQRQQAARALEGAAQPVREGWETLAEDVRRALYCGKLVRLCPGLCHLEARGGGIRLAAGLCLHCRPVPGRLHHPGPIPQQDPAGIPRAAGSAQSAAGPLLCTGAGPVSARLAAGGGCRRPGRRGLPGPVQRPELLRRPAGPGGHSGAAPGAAGLFWGPHL